MESLEANRRRLKTKSKHWKHNNPERYSGMGESRPGGTSPGEGDKLWKVGEVFGRRHV